MPLTDIPADGIDGLGGIHATVCETPYETAFCYGLETSNTY